MKGLLVRLSRTDSQAEAALQVIQYFDALVMGHATVEALVRGAAALAECPAGLRATGRPDLRFDAAGNRLDGTAGLTSQMDLGDGALVWLERATGPGPLDEIIVERMGVAARILVPSESLQGVATLAEVALVETVLSEREPAEERSKALRRLGLSPQGQLVVVAIDPVDTAADPAAQAVALLSRSRLARAAHIAAIDRTAAVLIQSADRGDLLDRLSQVVRQRAEEKPGASTTVRVGIGRQTSAMDAHESWSSALLALRFAGARSPDDTVVDVRQLGTAVALADIPRETWQNDAHVQGLQELAGSGGGQIDLAVLDAFLSSGSLRQAAAVLHMHHSSVASRLARVEEKLGWSFTSSQDVFDARLALTGLRLMESAPQRSGIPPAPGD